MLSRLEVSDSLRHCGLLPARLLGFSRQEYWSGLPFPSLGDLLDAGIEPVSPALADRFSTAVLPGKLWHLRWYITDNEDSANVCGIEETILFDIYLTTI